MIIHYIIYIYILGDQGRGVFISKWKKGCILEIITYKQTNIIPYKRFYRCTFIKYFQLG